MRTTDGVFVYTSADKDDWNIAPAEDTKVLIIGDSNVRRFSSIPKGWEVHCLPGAKLSHANNALENLLLRCSDTLKVVYVQAGINHRDDDPDTYRRNVEWLMTLNSHTTVQIAFVGVSRPPTLTPEQRRKIDVLNTMTADALVDQYVQPIADEHVEVLQKDVHRIHHTAFTSSKILSSVRKHAQIVHRLN